MNRKRLIHRVFWIEAIFFGLLVLFISVDDEFLIPKLISRNFPWTPATVANTLDSIWVICLFLLALSIQLKYLNKIKVLEGMLSVCASCKKIRDGHDHWHPIEEYIQQRSDADFTHTICPDCGVRLYGDLYLRATAMQGTGAKTPEDS